MHTPWGASQSVVPLAEGIISVSTASHGGVKLSPERQRAMPWALAMNEPWYEEDCDWSLVYLAFEDDIRAYALAANDQHTPYTLKNLGMAAGFVERWHPGRLTAFRQYQRDFPKAA